VPPGARVLQLARSSARPGQAVHSIGNPGSSGALWVYTQGSVRAVYHKKWNVRTTAAKPHEFEAEVVETQSPTNPGDSGGPLVNDRGELVGVTQGFAAGAQLLSLFIDISEVRDFLKRHHKLPRQPEPLASDTRARSRPGTEEAAGKSEEDSARAEHRAAMKLNFAKALEHDGKLVKAKERYEEIVADFPKTKAAAEAKTLLEKLNK
jgi:hypothetical protein